MYSVHLVFFTRALSKAHVAVNARTAEHLIEIADASRS